MNPYEQKCQAIQENGGHSTQLQDSHFLRKQQRHTNAETQDRESTDNVEHYRKKKRIS